MVEIKPNNNETYYSHADLKVFLAGSIEMGLAEDWQSRIAREFSDMENLVLFNPRRDDWDSSWEQKESNLQFNSQVNWELSKLDECDIIFMYFSPGTKSPISLLELGLYAESGKDFIVVCPPEFWRKGNVDIVSTKFNLRRFDSIESGIGCLQSLIFLHQNC